MPLRLRGMTWSHSRGYSSIVAVSQRYEELHPDLEIHWEKRSLAKFENEPVGDLARRYDLLIIDHPWSGFAAASGALAPLDAHLPAAFLEEQRKNSVGPSYASYEAAGHLYALPVDAATPVALYRPDRLQSGELPATWDDLLALAGTGAVIFAAKPVYAVLDFFMMCATLADKPEQLFNGERVADPAVAAQALEHLRALACRCDPGIFDKDPIEIHETLAGEDSRYRYCPFVYGYSNYCRAGYAAHALKATDVVTLAGGMLKTTLGGTGLALSSACADPEAALAFIMYAASPQIQRTLFFNAGGQPAHKAAWLDPEVNRGSNDFFRDTLKTMENASLRPRYNGYIDFQNKGGVHVREYMRSGRNLQAAIERINHVYRESRGATA
jgi:multiple sugar transport system substrate-binding protein